MRTFAYRFAKLLILSICGWCVMALTHEAGHICVGLFGGGKLQSMELRPWRIPHSLFLPDPHPQCTLWGGPILGCTVPLGLACIIRRNWAWFIANFCVIANGTYLALAWISGDPLLDTQRMIQEGVPRWCILGAILGMLGYGYPSFRRSVQSVLVSKAESA